MSRTEIVVPEDVTKKVLNLGEGDNSVNISIPQVLHLPNSGDCAVEYIEMFDEGRYGADKLFFRGRFKTIEEVKYQIETLLKMGSPITKEEVDLTQTDTITTYLDEDDQEVELKAPNLIGYKRWTAKANEPNKSPYTTNKHPLDQYPFKAKYPLNIMLRFKFYGGFGYMNIGDKWGSLYDENGNVKTADEQYFPTLAGKTSADTEEKYELKDLQIISTCWLSYDDALEIMETLSPGYKNSLALTSIDTQNSSLGLIDDEIVSDDDENLLLFS